jgi:hypothetical protein
MSWNYRVIMNDHGEHEIHEVYYTDEGEVDMMTESAITPYGEELDDLRWCLQAMLAACDKAVLEPEKIWPVGEEEPDE